MKKQLLVLTLLPLLLTGCGESSANTTPISNNSDATTVTENTSVEEISEEESDEIISEEESDEEEETSRYSFDLPEEYEEISMEEFTLEVSQVNQDLYNSNRVYTEANVKGSYHMMLGPTVRDIENIDATWALVDDGEGTILWTFQGEDETVSDATGSYYCYGAITYIMGLSFATISNSTLKFYHSVDGFKVEGTYDSYLDMGAIFSSSSRDYYEFNSDGIATTIQTHSTGTMTGQGSETSTTLETESTINFTVTHVVEEVQEEE